mmetsp:Transcript_66137/g.186243  ORF Transcript_66137/g.186243 Transcript_66137/m.186243 type:complete len:251 (+) Transcript_66137:238-990(+)
MNPGSCRATRTRVQLPPWGGLVETRAPFAFAEDIPWLPRGKRTLRSRLPWNVVTSTNRVWSISISVISCWHVGASISFTDLRRRVEAGGSPPLPPGAPRPLTGRCMLKVASRSNSPSPMEMRLLNWAQVRRKAVTLKVRGEYVGFATIWYLRACWESCGIKRLQDFSTQPGALFVMITSVPIVPARSRVFETRPQSFAICWWTSPGFTFRRWVPMSSALICCSQVVGRIVSSQSKTNMVSCFSEGCAGTF